jgi:hypothetical protein
MRDLARRTRAPGIQQEASHLDEETLPSSSWPLRHPIVEVFGVGIDTETDDKPEFRFRNAWLSRRRLDRVDSFRLPTRSRQVATSTASGQLSAVVSSPVASRGISMCTLVPPSAAGSIRIRP